MFQYEYEKRPPSSSSCDSRATATTNWSRSYLADSSLARRPLPPRPIACERMPTKNSVPLKVWVIASASCLAVCAVLVLATVVITRLGTGPYSSELLREPEPGYPNPHPVYITQKPQTTTEVEQTTDTNDIDKDLEILEKLSIFKNIVAAREKKTEDLISKPQLHPLHDTTIEHTERKIEKKDKAKLPDHIELTHIGRADAKKAASNFKTRFLAVGDIKNPIPDFKPTLPDVFVHSHGEIKLPDGYMVGLRRHDSEYEEYYNDDNLYDDYMQSNSMTNYLIEKVQELHDWISSDPDFEAVKNTTRVMPKGTEFSQVLKALNESLIQGNVSIIMGKLKDIYFGDNHTSASHSKRMVVGNSTDLLSFGILTLDIMLLHNIQLMAWENQEATRSKMLKEPDVFAFNALFMDPSKVEAKMNEVNHHYDSPSTLSKRQNLRQDVDDFDIGKSLLENLLDTGMSTARAAIHLGRAYKNTKAILNQLSSRESNNLQGQLSRDADGHGHALRHLQALGDRSYTELDCMWLLYCKNLGATAKLNAPYGTMARINGVALRMVSGELTADRAFETLLLEALAGWTDLRCDDMFPRCSKVNAASVVMDTILQPLKKSHAANKL